MEANIFAKHVEREIKKPSQFKSTAKTITEKVGEGEKNSKMNFMEYIFNVIQDKSKASETHTLRMEL